MNMLEPYICYPIHVVKTLKNPSFTKQGVFTFGSTFFHKTKRVKEILPLFERLNLDNFDAFKEFVETYGIFCFLTKEDLKLDITKTKSKDSIRKLSEMSGFAKEVSESWLINFWKNNLTRLKSEQKTLTTLIDKFHQYRFEVKEHFDDSYRWDDDPDFPKKIFGNHFTPQDLTFINSKLSGYHPRFLNLAKVNSGKFNKVFFSKPFQHIQDKGDWDKFQKAIKEISPSLVISSIDIDIVSRCYAEFCEWVSSCRSPKRCAYEKCEKYFIGRRNKMHCSDKCQKADEDKRRYLKKKTKTKFNQPG